jgi:Cohesin domain
MPRISGRTPKVAGVRRDHARRAAAAALILLSFAFASRTALATHSTSTIGMLAIDANSEGNAATSLGPLDGCSRIEPGAQITVDYVVDSVPQDRPMIGFEAEVRYNPQLLEVVAADHKLLLAAVGAHTPFSGQSDPVPDSDGSFRVQVLDTASITDPEANVERGAGVLARLTFRAKAAGLAALALTVSRDVYPVVLDTQNEPILVDRVGSASLAVGQDCPVAAQQPVITDMAEVNQQLLADNPGLAGGGSTPDAGDTSPSAGVTPEGQTPPAKPTPAQSPTAIPCAAPPPRTPGATATPLSPSPQPPEGAATSPADTNPPSPTPTEVVCTPTPTPIPDEILDVEEDSNTRLVIGAAALLTAGTAAAGSGWYLYRRSRLVGGMTTE